MDKGKLKRIFIGESKVGRSVRGAVALAAVVGNLGGADFSKGNIPFLANVHSGDSYGICLGVTNTYLEGSHHHGISLSLADYVLGGHVTGFSGSIFQSLNGISDGFAASLVNYSSDKITGQDSSYFNGVVFGLFSNIFGAKTITRGLQISLFFNEAHEGDYSQIAFQNTNPGTNYQTWFFDSYHGIPSVGNTLEGKLIIP